MRHTRLGNTDVLVSELSFGCGGTGGLLTKGTLREQEKVIGAAIERGVNYFDTSPGYPGSEEALGRVLATTGGDPVISTKFELTPGDLETPQALSRAIRASVDRSLTRLGAERLSVLQLHNKLGLDQGAAPEPDGGAVVTKGDVLRDGGILSVLRDLQQQGKVAHLGFTCLGAVAPAKELLAAGEFDTAIVFYSLLNPSAAYRMPVSFRHKDYENVIGMAKDAGVGVTVIRPLGAGALTSAEGLHPMAKAFSGLAIAELEADRVRARAYSFLAREGQSLAQAALRFVVRTPGVSTALVGFSDVEQVSELCDCVESGGLTAAEFSALAALYAGSWIL